MIAVLGVCIAILLVCVAAQDYGGELFMLLLGSYWSTVCFGVLAGLGILDAS